MQKFENLEELNRYYYSQLEELGYNSQNFSEKITKMFEKNILNEYENCAKEISFNGNFYSKYSIKQMRYERKKFIKEYKLKKYKYLNNCNMENKKNKQKLKSFVNERKRQIRNKKFCDLKTKIKGFFEKFKPKK